MNQDIIDFKLELNGMEENCDLWMLFCLSGY